MIPATQPDANNPIRGPSQEQIGWECDKTRDDQGLDGMDPAENDDLIKGVDKDCHKEKLRDIVPALAQKRAAVLGVGEHRPAVGGTVLPCIPQSGPDREQRGHQRLNDEPQMEKAMLAASKHRQIPCQNLVHRAILGGGAAGAGRST
jgi:hypothetical protein